MYHDRNSTGAKAYIALAAEVIAGESVASQAAVS
jgi:hypothetical protein